MGLREEDYPPEDVEVFSDNWDCFRVFDSMGTQWRVGMSGPTGLDYNVLPICLKSLGIKKKQLKNILPELRVMESEALKVMAEDRKRSQNKK